jgi:hypothetical protein
VIARTLSVWAGARLASRGARVSPAVRRWAFTGFLPQAGLALALPLLYPKILPGAADEPAALVLGIVGINQLLMPVLLRIALMRSGEGARTESEREPSATPARAPGS